MYTQPVPRSKHSISVIKTSQLMLYREIMAVCSEIHTKHINTVCGQNVELLNVKLAVHIVTTGIEEANLESHSRDSNIARQWRYPVTHTHTRTVTVTST